MKLVFSEDAWGDYLYWQKTDNKILKRINLLIQAIKRSPFEGIGKPEPLKHALSGYWSRRMNDEHRIVYRVESEDLNIAQLRYHYWREVISHQSEAEIKIRTRIESLKTLTFPWGES